MIDAERMLGSLVRNAMGGGRSRGRRRRRRGSSLLGGVGKGTLALGALGVAIGAFEHFTQKQAGAAAGASPAPAQPPLPPIPTLPPRNTQAAGSASLPPLPPLPAGAAPASTAPPPAPAAAGSDSGEALLMVRAMIAAANADHELDDDERRRILGALEDAEAGEEEKAFLLREIEEPIDLATLTAKASTPELANQVYLASLMAIEVDTRAERNYLDRLARKLSIEPERARELEAMLGGEASGDDQG